MSRYFATIVVPIHKENDSKAFEEAEKIRNSIEAYYDQTKLTQIVQNEFGAINKREINLTDHIF